MPDSSFLDAQLTYESLGSLDLDSAIATLDAALLAYSTSQTNENEKAVETTFAPLAEYYSKLANVNEILRNYINKTATNIGESDPRLLNEERYSNRVHPEEAVMPREATHSLIPELRQSSLPYLISVSVFMATLSIFLIFQMNGFSGQLNLPPSVTGFYTYITSPAFFTNPMIIGGISIIVLTALILFMVLYFQLKNTNSSRQ